MARTLLNVEDLGWAPAFHINLLFRIRSWYQVSAMQLPGERGNALAASYAGAAPVATGASTLIEREREREGTWWTHTGGGKGLPSKTTVAKTVL